MAGQDGNFDGAAPMSRISVSMSSDGRDSLAEFRDKVAVSEQAGAATMWTANHLFQRDPISLAAMSLAQTKRLRAGLMSISPFTIHPVQAAMAAATLDEFFPGRVTLCLGVGAPLELKSVGLDQPKPLAAMREAITVTRALLNGEDVKLSGKTFRVEGRRLALQRRGIPLVLAASGPMMLGLAGAVADGVMISSGVSIEFLKWALDHVREGAGARRVRTHALAYAAVDTDEGKAHDRLRRVLAIVLRGAHHAENLRRAGSMLDQAALNDAVQKEDWARAESMITDDIVRRHAVSGQLEQVRARFAEYQAAGVDEVVIAGVRDATQISKIMQAL
jgi:5,10-methylenetetrahydromethanopterin reductase